MLGFPQFVQVFMLSFEIAMTSSFDFSLLRGLREALVPSENELGEMLQEALCLVLLSHKSVK